MLEWDVPLLYCKVGMRIVRSVLGNDTMPLTIIISFSAIVSAQFGVTAGWPSVIHNQGPVGNPVAYPLSPSHISLLFFSLSR